MTITVEELSNTIEGSVVLSTKRAAADEGLFLKLLDTNQNIVSLEIGYSGCEGFTYFNGEEVRTDEP